MAKFETLPIPRFDQSLLSYLGRSFDRIRTAIQELDANVATAPKSAEVATHEFTASAVYVDLATPGPSVTLRTRTSVACIVSAQITSTGAVTNCNMGTSVTGATTILPGAAPSTFFINDVTVLGNFQLGSMCVFTTLNPGENTFKMMYSTGGGNVGFLKRRLLVIPLKV